MPEDWETNEPDFEKKTQLKRRTSHMHNQQQYNVGNAESVEYGQYWANVGYIYSPKPVMEGIYKGCPLPNYKRGYNLGRKMKCKLEVM